MSKRKYGLKKRPFGYTFLSALFLLEPIIKILHLKIVTGFSISLLMNTILHWNVKLQVAEYFLLFPLAGIALFRIRKKSYFLLILIQLYGLVKILSFTPYSWPYFTKEPILLIWGFVLINLIVLLYLLHPKNRQPFFDATIRWWESKTRYMVDFPCECQLVSDKGEDGKKVSLKVLNISQSGAFIKGDQFEKGQMVKLDFQLLNRDYSFVGIVMSVHPFNDSKGMGIQFKSSRMSLFSNLGLIFKLKKAGYKPVDGRA